MSCRWAANVLWSVLYLHAGQWTKTKWSAWKRSIQAWILEEQNRCLQDQLSLCTGSYWGYSDVMWEVTVTPNPFSRFILYQSGWKLNIYHFFAVVCLLLESGREIHPLKLTVKGLNHWVGQICWIKEQQFIALREVCCLLERWSAVPGAMWRVANLSETALPDRRSHPTFFICNCSNHCILH